MSTDDNWQVDSGRIGEHRDPILEVQAEFDRLHKAREDVSKQNAILRKRVTELERQLAVMDAG